MRMQSVHLIVLLNLYNFDFLARCESLYFTKHFFFLLNGNNKHIRPKIDMLLVAGTGKPPFIHKMPVHDQAMASTAYYLPIPAEACNMLNTDS